MGSELLKIDEPIDLDFWMSILLDVRIGLEINVLTSKFILLGDQMLGEMGCHPEICFYDFIQFDKRY